VLASSGYELADPVALALSGTDLFVANDGSASGNPGSITEVDAATGAPVKVLSGPQYGFDGPAAMAIARTELFVANQSGGSVTALPTNP
jgi:hypothetical protein